MKARVLTMSVVLSAELVGCGAGPGLPPFDPSRAVDTSDGYKQGGERIDRQSLATGLSQEPKAAPLVSRAKGIGIAAQVMAAVGGALIGYPLGVYLGGTPNPPWTLAYIGSGVAVTGIGLGFWSDAVFNDAVEAHNTSLGVAPEARLEWRGTSLRYTW